LRCFDYAVSRRSIAFAVSSWLSAGLALPIAILYANGVPAEYIVYAAAVLLPIGLYYPVAAQLFCRLFGVPPSPTVAWYVAAGSGAIAVPLTSLYARLGVPGPSAAVKLLLWILMSTVAASAAAAAYAYRCLKCLPKRLEGVEEVCRACEGVVDLHFVASAKGLRVETVYPEPGWGGLWKSAAVVNAVYLVFLLPPVYAAAPGMLLPTALAGIAVAALFTAVRAAISRRVGEPLCFRYASLPVQLAFLTLLVLDLVGVLRGAVIPAGPGPSIIVIPAAELSAAHTAMLLIDLYVAAKGRGKCGKFFGMCVGDAPWMRVVGQPHTAEAGGP